MKKSRGYTLIELSIALAVLGIVVVLIWRFVGYNAQHAVSNSEQNLLRSADMAVTGFVLSNNRLPCPDTNADGNEDCAAGSVVGRLPFANLGFSQANAGQIRYGVYRNPGVGIADADLATLTQDRMQMITTQGAGLTMTGTQFSNGQLNGIDFCAGLRTAEAKAPSNSFLHIITPGGNLNVAYALALPGSRNADDSGGILDSGNAGSTPGFEAPARATSGTYDDRVVAVGFDRLIGRLDCIQALASSTHAHANAATQAEMMRQAMADYKRQLDLIAKMAEANMAGGIAGVASSTAGVAIGAAEIALAIAQSITSLGAAAPIAALAIAGEVVAVIALASAIASLVLAVDAWNEAKGNVTEFANFQGTGFVNIINTHATRIRANANAADGARTF
jgi:prepilin-type N-terminal cleavage/methylation domain-containing protein